MSPLLLFGDLFYGLRRQGLKIGSNEWMALMEALANGAVRPDLADLYFVARALLIKSEAHYDVYDQVFAAVFGGKQLPTKAVEEILAWLEDPIAPKLTPEMIAALEKLPLEELRRMFEERLAEQRKRHDGGSRFIGTGGTSPFGHGGVHPSGVRVGGGGGGRSAVQIATERRFQRYRHDRVLDTRAMAVALKKLRRLSRRHADLELDVEDTIDQTSRNAGELTLSFAPPRRNEARVLLLMDVGGSMEPHAHVVENLFSAASSLDHWRRFESLAFHNCVYERLEAGREGKDEPVLTGDLLKERSPETFLIIVGDAYMAPSELLEPHGAIDYHHMNEVPGIVYLHRLRAHFARAAWLNPIPEQSWHGWTIKRIAQVFPMFPLTLDGLERAVDHLVRGAPDPAPHLGTMLPDLERFDRG